MRYFLQISLTDKNTELVKPTFPGWISEILPEAGEFHSHDLSIRFYNYKSTDKSLVDLNCVRPFCINTEYLLFIGGYALYRNDTAKKLGRYVPTPEELLTLAVESHENLYNTIKGNYHLVVYNRTRKTVNVITSPLSLYPAWFTTQNKVVYISNLLEPLIRIRENLVLNYQGLVEFTLFDHCLGKNTMYNGIYQFVSGNITTMSEERVTERNVYDEAVRWFTDKPSKRKESIESINQTLRFHLTKYIKSINNFNISLTGGFDGRLNFAYVERDDYSRLQAFSYGMKNSLQLLVPQEISSTLGFSYQPIYLNEEFNNSYAEHGFNSILYTGGVTPYIRANYPYSYNKIKDYSRNCILGQCDMIRPLYTNPAGAIFNSFSHSLFYSRDFESFAAACQSLSNNGFLNHEILTTPIIESIYNFVQHSYIQNYPNLNTNEKYYFFLIKESMLKFWQTECHLVDLFVDDFISFSDLDYIETLSHSEYFGLYKGIFASNQFGRRKGHDLYADLMHINNSTLNNIQVDRFFKPIWIRRQILGYPFIAYGKYKALQRKKRMGNDTFNDKVWSQIFFNAHKKLILQNNHLFNVDNLFNNQPYSDNNSYRFDRHISLKIWLQHIGIE